MSTASRKPALLNSPRPGPAPTNKILRAKPVEERVGLHRGHIWRLEKAGKFPQRIRLNPEAGNRSAIGWLEREIDAWIEARAAERDSAAA